MKSGVSFDIFTSAYELSVALHQFKKMWYYHESKFEYKTSMSAALLLQFDTRNS